MYVSGILSGNRAKLARAITLIESRNSEHQILAQEILIKLLPQTGKSLRIGVSGLPGSGKSTFIDAFGTMLTAAGRKVAVLAVDPTSSRTGGSILGDKTRMAQLAVDPEAFIRPSPTSGTLGGVAHATREAILLCEAAGYNVILVETVGVGQSEITVSEMVDFFLVLMIAGGGDELQGIKKGVLEIADMIAITKSDGDNTSRAAITAADYQHALRIITPNNPNWVPPVITISAQDNNGLDVLWNKIDLYHTSMQKSGEWASKRRSQQIRWMWSMVDDRLKRRLKADPKIKAMIPDLEKEVGTGRLIPTLAVDKIFSTFGV
ncbi:MAG: methylmalonyl Co-A mutase-associated GTPase MeaB [Candidatus Marinimicrobia bacterium]|nr:methylmalonyl Co-A mutase-associated GTPase MeaB [Candidatus Neomarinimicrobiota bacterium]